MEGHTYPRSSLLPLTPGRLEEGGSRECFRSLQPDPVRGAGGRVETWGKSRSG